METSLHRQLKALYAGPEDRVEVKLGAFRIDVVRGAELVEIQHGSLSAIRDKIRKLCEAHEVLVVKPIIARKTIVKRNARGKEVSRRMSPKRGVLLDLFEELVYFTSTFPRERLSLEVRLVEIEEFRAPGHGRRRRWRKDDHVVVDQVLLSASEPERFQNAADLMQLLPALPETFHTGDLAVRADIPRHVAQRIAYCLRKMGAARTIGKSGNAILYQVADAPRMRKRKAA